MSRAGMRGFWRHRRLANVLLLPLSAVFAVLVRLRRWCYQHGVLPTTASPIPVVVIGNIVVGGGGKTPAVIDLVQKLQAQGLKPGVVSRGFGGNYQGVREVADTDDWRVCGDEPLLIRQRTGAPVCLARRRALAVARLARLGCDIAVSDDGLQHYALRRDLEICLINEAYGWGNGWLLPAGPLREPKSRAATCDLTIIVGDTAGSRRAELRFGEPYQLAAPQTPADKRLWKTQTVVALAGIARPEAFFAALQTVGITPRALVALGDHQALAAKRLAAIEADVIVMTEKDAVKYPSEDSRLYALPMYCHLPGEVVSRAASLVSPSHV